MRLLIAAIGRARRGPEQALYAHYAGRLRWPLTLKEIVEPDAADADARRRRAAERLRAAVPDGARLVALNETGTALDSPAFAARLGGWQDGGIRDVAFLIGGADGLDPSLVSEADLVLALGRLTWPHMLVRPLLAEQLYRAETILAGHPYHRG